MKENIFLSKMKLSFFCAANVLKKQFAQIIPEWSNSLSETLLQGIIVFVFIIFDQIFLLIKDSMIRCKRISQREWIFSRGSMTRGLLSSCANFARIIEVHSLINKPIFKRQIFMTSTVHLIFIPTPSLDFQILVSRPLSAIRRPF